VKEDIDMADVRMSRRHLMKAVVLGGVAAAALGRPRSVAADVPPEWPPVLAGAKKEGKVVVQDPPLPRDGHRQLEQ